MTATASSAPNPSSHQRHGLLRTEPAGLHQIPRDHGTRPTAAGPTVNEHRRPFFDQAGQQGNGTGKSGQVVPGAILEWEHLHPLHSQGLR